jgi:acyl-CoA ligase (AMP-forming) (exosortase A-associated)
MKPCLIQHLLEASAIRVPDKPCIIDGARKLGYAETLDDSRRIAGALVGLGIRSGDHVGILLDKSIEQVLAMFGTWIAGGVVVILNPILTKDQILHIVKDCGLRTLITSGSKVENRKVRPEAESKIRMDVSELQAAGVRRAAVFQADHPAGFESEIRIPGDFQGIAPFEGEVRRVTDDMSHIIYTSGSTGMPKGIVVSHRNSIDGAKIVSQYTGLNPEDRILGALPFNFDYGFNQLMNAVHLGATMVLHNFFMPNDLLKALEKEAVTVFAGMPPIWLKLFNPKLCDLSRPYDFSQLRVITNTGGKVPVPVVRKLRSLFPKTRIFLMYGLTEAFRSTFLDPSEIDRRPDSIGKAIPNVEVFVVNADGGECGPEEEGELVHRGALITKGYWNNSGKTAEVFRPNPLLGPDNRHLETVVFSGDTVRKDSEGFIYYVGRRDAMIKTKGYRVSPTEVEELFAGVQGVAECVASGYEKDDEILLRVFVTLSKPDATPAGILAQCKKQFPFYLVPDDLVVMQHFPLTANGKIDRTRVIREYTHDVRKA